MTSENQIGPRSDDRAKSVQAERVVIGLCPRCRAVLVVLNWREAWPLAYCECSWVGATTELADRQRYERGGAVHRHDPPTPADPSIVAARRLVEANAPREW
jgi:hypothetical protein